MYLLLRQPPLHLCTRHGGSSLTLASGCHSYNFDMSSSYPKWIDDMADAAACSYANKPTQGLYKVPEEAPFFFGGKLDQCSYPGDPAWSSAFIALVDWVQRYHGDTAILSQHYDGAVAYVEYLTTFVNTTEAGAHLLDVSFPGTRHGDWMSPVPTNTSGKRHTSNLINGFYWIKQLRILARAAVLLGKTTDALRWKAFAAKAEESYNTLFFDPAAGRYRDIDCKGPQPVNPSVPCNDPAIQGILSEQTAQSLPLHLDLPATPADAKRVGAALADAFVNGM